MMPGPIDEVRALFQHIFASIKPFLPPPTDAVKIGEICNQPCVSLANISHGRG